MNSIQITALQPAFNVLNIQESRSAPSRLCVVPPHNSLKFLNHNGSSSNYQCIKLPKSSLKLTARASKYLQLTPVCLFGDKGKSGGGNWVNPWESLKKAMGSFKKELSVEDALKEQMEKLERFGDGGGTDDGNRPGGGGGGGGGGNFGGPEDDKGGVPDSADEPLQVLGAILGLLFLYSCILDYEETIALTKDVIKLLVGLGASNRLRKIAATIECVIEELKPEVEEDPYWLEHEILDTPTWWDRPRDSSNSVFKSSDFEKWSPEYNDIEKPSYLESSEYYENVSENPKTVYWSEDENENEGEYENDNEYEKTSYLESSEYYENKNKKSSYLEFSKYYEDENEKTSYFGSFQNYENEKENKDENEKTSYLGSSENDEDENEKTSYLGSSENDEDEDENEKTS